jgi:quinoprotein glucose dehydrogenase
MIKRKARAVIAALSLMASLVLALPRLSGQTVPSTPPGEWRYPAHDAGGTRYSPLDQISRNNVKDLRIAWRWKTENFGPKADYNYQVTPIMVRGGMSQ